MPEWLKPATVDSFLQFVFVGIAAFIGSVLTSLAHYIENKLNNKK